MFFSSLEDKIINNDKELKRARKEFKEMKHKGSVFKFQIKKMSSKLNALERKQYDVETKYILKNIKRGVYLGVGVNLETFDKKAIILPWEDWINHSIIYGTTRMGKTKMMLNIIRQNLLHGDNVIINDPKGGIDHEILNQLVLFLRESDRLDELIYINPVYPNATEYFNPIYGLGDDDIASLLSTILYPNAQGDAAFYSGYAFAILKTLLYSLRFLETAMDPTGASVAALEKKEQEKYLRIKKLRGKELLNFDIENNLANPDVAERIFSDMTYTELDNKNAFNRTFVTFKDILHYLSWGRMEDLQSTITSVVVDEPRLIVMKDEVLSLFEKLMEIPKEHHAKVALSLTNFISDVANGLLGAMFCTVRINPLLARLSDPKRGFAMLIHPSPLKFKKVAETVNKIFMKMIESAYGVVSVTGRKLNHRRLYAHLDEGESSLYPGIESVLNKLAGLGFTLNIYTQSIADLESKLGKTIAKVSQDSLNTYFVFKMNDTDSIDTIKDMFGETSVTSTNIVHGNGEARINFSANIQSLVTTKSLSNLRPAECFLKNLDRRYQISCAFVPDVDQTQGVIVMDEIEVERTFSRLVALDTKFGLHANTQPA
ncbi:hypothetical protein CQA49_00860 [Helicobacter sp. MIT 00-7814]|uniref:type IV secretory system conjugative DNA transfer family protein n=1 Tax=unclassified Helicobacter TaxID=2593540 RepID=UPI000E1EF138|nr:MULTISPECIES: type IV secretion system DNA-binding domain-containing protein [unclassified Helicobacter]RDU55063.1 hypothetical protein CQA37_04450 [Helicobacter sp. MIT 99-10781]RDU56882.1 hypothetical protein CQA49_00860 [Helicobacter sp. MIT 00-7814]